MTKRRVRNMAASVLQRLNDLAKATARDPNQVRLNFAMGRFLARLAQSRHADKFVLKGGLLLAAWRTERRSTKDIDLLGHLPNDMGTITKVICEICQQPVEPDGLDFDPQTVAASLIREDADYEGVRVEFYGRLGQARVPMQIDVGFGDVIVPPPTMTELPIQLDFPPTRLRGYPREAMVAEKLEAMVKLGVLNSRMKDFFDIWVLAQQFDFDGPTIERAVRATFDHRGTDLAPVPAALTFAFANDPQKSQQWQAFIRRAHVRDAPADLAEVVRFLATFLLPILAALTENRPFHQHWQAPGPWRPRDG